MKKLLGIVVLGLLWCNVGFAKNVKPGSGPLKLSDDTVKFFHIYLTEKLTHETTKEKNFPGYVFPYGMFTVDGAVPGPNKPRYADYFFIRGKNAPWIFGWGIEINQNPGTQNCGGCRMFAIKNKIVWKGGKKKISRKVTLEELKTILKDLGFYDG